MASNIIKFIIPAQLGLHSKFLDELVNGKDNLLDPYVF